MNKDNDALSDEEAIDFSPDMWADIQREEAKKKKAAAEADDDDDDFDLLDDEDEEDDDPDTGASEDDDDDEQEEDEAEPSRASKAAGKKPDAKGKQTAKERIEELAEKRREAEARELAAELKLVEREKALEEMEARLRKLETGEIKAVGEKPDPEKYEFGKADDRYADDMIEWRLQQERSKWEKQRSETSSKSENERLRKHYEDRHLKIQKEGKEKYGDKFERLVDQLPFSPEVARDLLDSDQGVDISYYLANNIGKLRELTQMSAAQRARAMGRLEERFSAQSSAAKKRSKAPDTPNRKAAASKKKVNSRYGPEDQDEFDKALWNL